MQKIARILGFSWAPGNHNCNLIGVSLTKPFGGLPARTRRALKAAVKADGKAASPPIPGRGTRLIREWHGRLHEVEVLDDSYLYRGERHRSLSAIARAITGTKWSGPRFFALREGP